MTIPVRLDHCIECAQPTNNRSLICDACEPEYRDARTHNEDDAGALLERGAWEAIIMVPRNHAMSTATELPSFWRFKHGNPAS